MVARDACSKGEAGKSIPGGGDSRRKGREEQDREDGRPTTRPRTFPSGKTGGVERTGGVWRGGSCTAHREAAGCLAMGRCLRFVMQRAA